VDQPVGRSEDPRAIARRVVSVLIAGRVEVSFDGRDISRLRSVETRLRELSGNDPRPNEGYMLQAMRVATTDARTRLVAAVASQTAETLLLACGGVPECTLSDPGR